jgi:hypothetical protein
VRRFAFAASALKRKKCRNPAQYRELGKTDVSMNRFCRLATAGSKNATFFGKKSAVLAVYRHAAT